ncbi:hypothetical protein [Burkholderia lata]|uniref:hypothetical protein n=1 Tax=Burkholderia lata (strain ATCC 17760 / DSM 23089 / LMG 22485 / NCIMB 9086 / R18194 / 383) TaxID=482957 RepID=UPI00399A0025
MIPLAGTKMPLVLNAHNNANYGGNLINQKYSPLADILINNVDQNEYRQLFSNRIQILTGVNAYPPNALNLYADLPGIDVAHAPLVVISSGRAEWMRDILQTAGEHPDFTGYLDNQTFRLHGAPCGPVPWYSPRRSGRPLFVVVHWSEYDYYVQNVGDGTFPDVTIVGFKFTAAHPALDVVGFGASRYAALQFVVSQGYHRAWAVDDNVVNINGFPNDLAAVEANMPANSPIWGISFSGATTNGNYAALYNGTVRFQAVPYNFSTTTPGLLQQVVLWNLDLLRQANLNFCPMFVTSNEDISLSNFLRATNRDQRIITGLRVVKYEPTSDSNANLGYTVEIPKRRNRVLQIFNGIEYDTQIDPGTGQVDLSAFVINTILPQAHQPQSTALVVQSRAIEQVMAAATLRGPAWSPPTAFNPYNGAPVVQNLQSAVL